MSSHDNQDRVSGLRLTPLTGDEALAALGMVRELYAEVYVEPPYCEGPEDVDEFAEDWPRRVAQPGFRLLLAFDGDLPIGFTFGHQLRPDTQWWDGATTPFPADVTQEWSGRTFVIIELAVRKPYRGRGVGKALHNALLTARTEKRVTLLARPEAEPALRAYQSWGYHKVGQIIPFAGAPLYDSFIRNMPSISAQLSS